MNVISFSDVTGALQGWTAEASAELTWAFVCARTNYKDAFVGTDEAVAGKVVRRYSKWEKGLSEEQKDKFLMLANLDSTARLFCHDIAGAIPEVAVLFSMRDEVFLSELYQFVAMKVFEAKASAAQKGKTAFFSSEGMRSALALVMRKENRKFSHEARGRAARFSNEVEEITEERIKEIVSEVWNERYDSLFTILPTPAVAPPSGFPIAGAIGGGN
ncbi:MAG: hypothetical protein EOM15_15190 [Spirochaetia bacterium]|nr:hypothetical protein [Spirochaetia bacterium]